MTQDFTQDPISTGPVDPQRPWIEDPRDAPSAMQMLPSLFDPFGATSRLHFTRVWTVLFFARLFVFLVPWLLVALLASAGAEDTSFVTLPNWAFPAFVLVTALMSTVLHVRRFNSAERSPLWALIVMLPVLVGGVGFLVGGMQGVQAYNAAVEQRNNPTPPAPMDAAAGDAADAEGGDGDDGQNRGRERGEPLDVTEVSARAHAADTGFSTAIAFWALPSFLVMLWSLLWVGRLPNGGGTIRDRLDGMIGAP